MKNRTLKSKTYGSLRTFASAVGVTHPTIKKTLQIDECPVGGKGPWTDGDVTLIKAFRAQLQTDRAADHHLTKDEIRKRDEPLTADSSPRTQAQIIDLKLKTERMLKTRIEREILEKKYVSRDEMEHGRVQRVTAVRQRLLGIGASLAPSLIGLDVAEVQQVIDDQMRQILMAFSS